MTVLQDSESMRVDISSVMQYSIIIKECGSSHICNANLHILFVYELTMKLDLGYLWAATFRNQAQLVLFNNVYVYVFNCNEFVCNNPSSV